MKDYIRLHIEDNVVIALRDLKKNDPVVVEDRTVLLQSDIPFGHKIAIRPIAYGDKIYKYGLPIGSASDNIRTGEHVHSHNLKTDYTIKTEAQ